MKHNIITIVKLLLFVIIPTFTFFCSLNQPIALIYQWILSQWTKLPDQQIFCYSFYPVLTIETTCVWKALDPQGWLSQRTLPFLSIFVLSNAHDYCSGQFQIIFFMITFSSQLNVSKLVNIANLFGIPLRRCCINSFLSSFSLFFFNTVSCRLGKHWVFHVTEDDLELQIFLSHLPTTVIAGMCHRTNLHAMLWLDPVFGRAYTSILPTEL